MFASKPSTLRSICTYRDLVKTFTSSPWYPFHRNLNRAVSLFLIFFCLSILPTYQSRRHNLSCLPGLLSSDILIFSCLLLCHYPVEVMALSPASSSSPPPYLLAFEGAAHTKAVRCVCTVETSHDCIPSSKSNPATSSSTTSSSSSSSSFPSSHTEIITGSLDKSIIVWSSISPDRDQRDLKANSSSSQAETQDKSSGAADRAPLQYKPRLHLTPHRDFVYCVAPCLSEKGTSFFSGSKDQRALRISLRDGHTLASYVVRKNERGKKGHKKEPRSFRGCRPWFLSLCLD